MNKYRKILEEMKKEGNGEIFKTSNDIGWKGKKSDLSQKEARKAMREDFKKAGINNIIVKDSFYYDCWAYFSPSNTITVEACDDDFIQEDFKKLKEDWAKHYMNLYGATYERALELADEHLSEYEQNTNEYYIDKYEPYTEEFKDKLKLIMYIAHTYRYYETTDDIHNNYKIIIKKV